MPQTPHRDHREDWLNLVDEASVETFDRADFDPAFLASADTFAKMHRLPKGDEGLTFGEAMDKLKEFESV